MNLWLSSCEIKAWKKIQAWTGEIQALISQLLKVCV